MSEKSVLVLQGQLAPYRRALFNALARHYRVSVLHAGPAAKGADDRFAELVVPQRRVGPFHLQDRGAIRAAMRGHDVTVAMFDLRWPAYCLPVLSKDRPAFILHGHRYSGRPLADRARNFLMKRADRLLLYGDEEVPQMVASGIDPDRIVIAPNTIDVPNHADLSASPKRNFLYVGRLQDRKRLDLAIAALARLQGRIDPGIGLDIVGAGEPEAALRQCAEQAGIGDKVHFHGAVHDPERLKGFFESAIAYVSPGPVGLAVLHSFAFGVPVVTLREGRHGPEFHNIRNEENGLILEDEQAFEAALHRLGTDSTLRRELGRNAYRLYASSRTLDHMVAGFRKAIDAGRSDPVAQVQIR